MFACVYAFFPNEIFSLVILIAVFMQIAHNYNYDRYYYFCVVSKRNYIIDINASVYNMYN